MANPITAAFAAAKLAAKKRAVAESKTGNIKKIKKSINKPKMQSRFENLARGSNTLSPSAMARTNATPKVPTKTKPKNRGISK